MKTGISRFSNVDLASAKTVLAVLGAVACVLVLVGFLSVSYLMKSPLRRNLPWNSTEIKEEYWSDFGDYVYALSAKISEEDFQRYLKNLKVNDKPAKALHFPSDDRISDGFYPTAKVEVRFLPTADAQQQARVGFHQGKVYVFAYGE